MKQFLLTGFTAVFFLLISCVLMTKAFANGTGDWCTFAARTPLCMYASGRAGHDIYGHVKRSIPQEKQTIVANKACTKRDGSKTQYVQSKAHGDKYDCPFSHASLDNEYYGKEIVTQKNVSSGKCFVGTARGGLIQDSCAPNTTDVFWIELRGSTGSTNYQEFLNVYSYDQTYNSTDKTVECTNGENKALVLQSGFTTPNCQWKLE